MSKPKSNKHSESWSDRPTRYDDAIRRVRSQVKNMKSCYALIEEIDHLVPREIPYLTTRHHAQELRDTLAGMLTKLEEAAGRSPASGCVRSESANSADDGSEEIADEDDLDDDEVRNEEGEDPEELDDEDE